MDIRSGAHGLFATLEGIVFDQLDTMAVIDQRVSGDTGLLLVWLTEPAVDDKAFAVGAGRCFAFDRPHGHMAVDDTSCGGIEPELLQDALAYMLVIGEGEIGTFLLFVGCFVFEEIPLEGSHLILVIERGELAFPEVEQIIEGILFGFAGAVVRLPYDLVDTVHEGFSGDAFAEHLDLGERSVGIEGYGGMIEQETVPNEV